MIGRRLAQYEILEKLGEGGMGEVWRARDTALDREVAIKVLPELFARDAERLARFEREAKLLASLNHSGIAVIHGLHAEEGVRFLAMELVPGEDLAKRLGRGPLPLDEALFVGVQVAEALEAAHAQGVVHRDLKPANVILTPDGRTKVLDFGLAKAFESEGPGTASLSPTVTSADTAAGVLLGTAAYMSPEQARAKPVDKRTDVWSFGCLLFECLTGRNLFKGESISDSLGAILHKEPDWSQLPSGTPPTVRLLLRRCLTRDLDKRLHDIADARIELEQAIEDPQASAMGLAGDAIAAADAQQRAKLIRPARRRWIAAGMAGGLLAGSAAGWLLRGSPAAAPLRKFDLGVQIDAATGGELPYAVISPDGSRVAFLHQDKIWLRALDELEARPLEGTGDARAVFWSPDGAQLGYFADAKLWKVPASGGRPVAICDLGAEAIGGRGGSWSDDGRIVYSRGSTGLLEVSALGGEPRELVPLAEGERDLHEPHLLPGGRGILFVSHPEDRSPGTLWLFHDGERRILLDTEKAQDIGKPEYAPSGHILLLRSGGEVTAGLWALPFSLESLQVAGEPFLVASDASTASVSRDGTLAFVHLPPTGGEWQLVWLDRAGRLIDPIGAPRRNAAGPSLSPDGRRLAFGMTDADTGRFDLWVHDLERGAETRLTDDEAFEFGIRWMPSGKEIVFNKWNDEEGVRFFSVPADGLRPERAIGGGRLSGLTPDGLGAIVSAQPDGDPARTPRTGPTDIFLVPLDGTERRPIVTGSARKDGGSVSPDGRWLAYRSDSSGHDEVYLTRFPSGEDRWQVSVGGGGGGLFWDRRGGRLYFVEEKTLVEVEVADGDPPRLGKPVALFELPPGTRGVTVTPDGARFIAVARAGDAEQDEARPGIKIVQNWVREFE